MATLRMWSGAFALALVGLVGCGDDSEGSAATGGDSATTGGSVGGGTDTTAATASAGESEGGTGSGTATSGTSGGEEGVLPDLFGVPNVDDDDQNGARDWNDPAFDGDNDLSAFALPQWYLDGLGDGDSVALSLDGELDQVRFWRGDAVALGHNGGAPATDLVLGADEAGAAFKVEFADFLRGATLTVRHLDGEGGELRSDVVELWSAPMLVNHHLQPAEYVWAVAANSNQSMISAIASVVGDRFIVVDSPDVWIQDELEWALATAPGKRLNVAVDSIRDRPLDAYVKGLRAPDVEPMTWGNPAQETTEDKFGNLEVTPPHRALNHDLQADRIDPVREQLMAELDLDEADVLRIPAIFERIWGCSYKDSNAVAAMIPGMLNLTVVNFAGEGLRIFVSDPFLRSDAGDQSGDPLIANFKAALPPDYEIHFVDDWYTYHVAIGEVHCGTNVARSPVGEWWTDARHLFTEP
ncbi:MAG: protein-arginine deiminase family protein [Nannocystaceae bacterium]